MTSQINLKPVAPLNELEMLRKLVPTLRADLAAKSEELSTTRHRMNTQLQRLMTIVDLAAILMRRAGLADDAKRMDAAAKRAVADV